MRKIEFVVFHEHVSFKLHSPTKISKQRGGRVKRDQNPGNANRKQKKKWMNKSEQEIIPIPPVWTVDPNVSDDSIPSQDTMGQPDSLYMGVPTVPDSITNHDGSLPGTCPPHARHTDSNSQTRVFLLSQCTYHVDCQTTSIGCWAALHILSFSLDL